MLINSYGIKWLTRINNGVTLFKIIVPTIIIIIFLYVGFFETSTPNLTAKDLPNDIFSFKDTFTAIVAGGLVYTFNGFQTVASYGSEIRNPKKKMLNHGMIFTSGPSMGFSPTAVGKMVKNRLRQP